MEFVCQFNAWVSNRNNRSLREKTGYIKSKDVAGPGKPGYIRSIAMAAKNVQKIRERGEHRAQQRTEHANTGGPAVAARDRPARAQPDEHLRMEGIDEALLSPKWCSCTIATPGQHMPTAFYTVLRRWILATVAIIKALLAIEVGTDKFGFTASSRRNGNGRGGGGRGRGSSNRGRRRRQAAGGKDDEEFSEVGYRHCHCMLLINSPEGYDDVLTAVMKNLIEPIAGHLATPSSSGGGSGGGMMIALDYV